MGRHPSADAWASGIPCSEASHASRWLLSYQRRDARGHGAASPFALEVQPTSVVRAGVSHSPLGPGLLFGRMGSTVQISFFLRFLRERQHTVRRALGIDISCNGYRYNVSVR